MSIRKKKSKNKSFSEDTMLQKVDQHIPLNNYFRTKEALWAFDALLEQKNHIRQRFNQLCPWQIAIAIGIILLVLLVKCLHGKLDASWLLEEEKWRRMTGHNQSQNAKSTGKNDLSLLRSSRGQSSKGKKMNAIPDPRPKVPFKSMAPQKHLYHKGMCMDVRMCLWI